MFEVTKIRECGSSNVLRWAIKNNANIKEDIQLQSIINDMLGYQVTIKGLNTLEVFKLAQMYRDKLRILSIEPMKVPARSDLIKMYPGVYKPDEETEGTQIGVLAEHAINSFCNIALQMKGDEEIIQPSTAQLYLPMISQMFTVQIPVGFIDFVHSMSSEECMELFSSDYPATLNKVIEKEVHGARMMIELGTVRGTAMANYNERYEKYLKAINYSPLSGDHSNRLFKLGMLGFSKYDRVQRADISAVMFKANAEELTDTMKRMGRMDTPLKLTVTVQMPISTMMLLYNSYSNEDLPMYAHSSINDILDSGMPFSNFVAMDEENPDQAKIEGIENYKTRIAQANQQVVNVMEIALQSDGDTDVTAVFAMLPSMYSCKAVMTVDTSMVRDFMRHSDPEIAALFTEINKLANGINADISKVSG